MSDLYKVIRGGESWHGGTYVWSLPVQGADGMWTPGEWTPAVKPSLCSAGWHLTSDPARWWGDGDVWGACALFGRFGIRGVVEYAARARAWNAPKVGYDKRGRWKVLAPESTDATSARPVMEPVLLHCGFRRGVHLDGGECWSHDDPALDNSTFVRASKLLLARLVAGAESVQSPGAPADSRRPTGRHLRGA